MPVAGKKSIEAEGNVEAGPDAIHTAAPCTQMHQKRISLGTSPGQAPGQGPQHRATSSECMRAREREKKESAQESERPGSASVGTPAHRAPAAVPCAP